MRCFSDQQRAVIFQREFAQCQITGRNLWILDYGIIYWEYDQIDHIVPFSKGGETELYNGALLCSNSNYFLKDSKNKKYKYSFGFPTEYYFYSNNMITPTTLKQMLKFSRLDISDYYFNRALSEILFALDWRYNPNRINGRIKDRDDVYYMKAALKKLELWRKNQKPGYLSFEERGLLEPDLEQDQKLLLDFRNVSTLDEAKIILDKLIPIYSHWFDTYSKFFERYNFFLDKHFVDVIHTRLTIRNVADIIDSEFKTVLDMLNCPETLPRFKKYCVETINALKQICLQILKYRFIDDDGMVKQNVKVYFYDCKNILNRHKTDNDSYCVIMNKVDLSNKNIDGIPLKDLIIQDISNLFTYIKDSDGNIILNDDLIEYFVNHTDFSGCGNVFYITDSKDEGIELGTVVSEYLHKNFGIVSEVCCDIKH